MQAQTNRTKILGIGRVVIASRITPSQDPVRFYSELRLSEIAAFQTGAPVHIIYALNPHQEVYLSAGPRPEPAPHDPPQDNVFLILFEVSDVIALHDYLKSRQVDVNPVTVDSFGVKDAHGQSVTGNPLLFTLRDPDGHSIGFIQFRSPLKPRREDGQTSSRLIHAGFVVKDRAAMDKFYKDILGFHMYWHGGMKDGETDWVDMQVPDGTDWIEYMLNVPENADKQTLGIMNHIALGVPDVRAAAKQLEAQGMKLPEPPQMGRDGKWQLNLYDPDDTRVELMEFTPTQKPCCSDYTGPHPKP